MTIQYSRGVVGLVLLISPLLFAACSGEGGDDGGPLECTETQLLCGERCVDPRFDAQNCGGCGIACEEGELCTQGSCVATCEAPKAICAGECVDLESSPEHCGGCGLACGDGELCVAGRCETDCPEGLEACDGACVDIDTSTLHCGACGTVCGEGQLCDGGTCVCPPNLEACDGTCVDTREDSQNCGACGNACEDGLFCNAGTCSCPWGLTACGEGCTDTWSDLENCGECGTRCEAGPNAVATCDSGLCRVTCLEGWGDCDGDPTNGCETDLLENNEHCGACNAACTGGENVADAVCVAGQCSQTCELGWATCLPGAAQVCAVDLLNDPQFCGSCSVNCTERSNVAVATCENRECGIELCAEGWGDCDDSADNGCETELLENIEHCGACGEVCESFCVDGSCAGVVSVHAGSNFTCAILDGGKVACWGGNSYGQVGNGQTGGNVLHPALVVDLDDVVEMSAGAFHACALTASGEVWCWGQNSEGCLGDGSAINSSVPVRADAPAGATSVYASDAATCAGYANGDIYCWGKNTSGRFGDGTTDNTFVPVKSALEGERLLLSSRHACALSGDKVQCVGDQALGRLGNRTSSGQSLAPVSPHGLEPVASVARHGLYASHSCVVLEGGLLKCWGSNDNGQIGNGVSGYGNFEAAPVLVPGIVGAAEVAMGESFSCALLDDRSVRCWGHNYYGQLGDGTTDPKAQPVQLKGLTGVKQIALGRYHGCAVHGDDQVSCWGFNISGQLGQGTTESPKTIPMPLSWR